MPWTRYAVALAAALALLAPAGGCKKKKTDEIVVGHYGSMTGEQATFGKSTQMGIDLALDEINAKGGVLGKKVRVAAEDTRGLEPDAKTAAQRLVDKENVVALIGEVASGCSIAAAPVAQAAKIPMLSPASTNPEVTKKGDYIFRSCFIDPFQGPAMAKFAMRENKPDAPGLGLKKFAVLFANNAPYSVGLKDEFIRAVKEMGGEITAVESYAQGDANYTGQLTKIRDAAVKADAIYVPGYYSHVGQICRDARNLGLTVPLMGGDGWDSSKLAEIGGDAINGCYFTNHYSAEEDRPEVQAFVESFKRKFNGEVPDAMAILGYDAMRIMADAIQRAGSTDGAKIRDALAKTRDFAGATGKITINADRNAEKPLVVLKIVNKQFKFVARIDP